jgi:sugar-specific transcriptional regulator TrmB
MYSKFNNNLGGILCKLWSYITEHDQKEELKIRKKDSESEKPFLAQDEQSIAENIINLRNSAINKLKTLGLTEDEAKAIVGI